jgi:hypothetical protein
MWEPKQNRNALPPGVVARVSPEAELDLQLFHHATFVNRTQYCFKEQRRLARAAGASTDYQLGDLRQLVRNHLGERHCYFCRGPITMGNFGIVARVPPERGGGFGFHNLEVVCGHCGETKGSLDRVEFRELFDLLRSWSPFVRHYFLERLRTGVCRTDFLFRRPNRTIRPPQDMTTTPPPPDERPTGSE